MKLNLDDADVLEALDHLWLISVALVSIAVALWALWFTIDDLAWRVRLVGVQLRHWTPLDPADRPAHPVEKHAPSAVKPDLASGAGSAPAKDIRGETADLG